MPVYDQAKKLLATFKSAMSALSNIAACDVGTVTPSVQSEEKTVKDTLEKEYGRLPSGASSRGALRGVQDVPYRLDVACSSPGYWFADPGRELPGGSAQLAEC
ncbi:UNVERIFIED_CONTAM: hypothetical protein FKN15_062089 [Acipenser sinensis]